MIERPIISSRGLPGRLPPGERLLWQGTPDPLRLARDAYHARAVAIYFAGLTTLAAGVAVTRGSAFTGVIATAVCGGLAVALLHLLGWASARSTVYSLTDRRIVLRVGVALPTSINLPLAKIAAVDVSSRGDVVLRLSDTPPLGWLVLWPHARPWRLSRPEPMLRGLQDGATVAARIARACLAVQPDGRVTPIATPTPRIMSMPEVAVA